MLHETLCMTHQHHSRWSTGVCTSAGLITWLSVSRSQYFLQLSFLTCCKETVWFRHFNTTGSSPCVLGERAAWTWADRGVVNAPLAFFSKQFAVKDRLICTLTWASFGCVLEKLSADQDVQHQQHKAQRARWNSAIDNHFIFISAAICQNAMLKPKK